MGLIVFITIILAFGCLPKKNTLENQNKKEEKTINDNNEEPIIIYESQGIFLKIILIFLLKEVYLLIKLNRIMQLINM
jgi:hypothetical protein